MKLKRFFTQFHNEDMSAYESAFHFSRELPYAARVLVLSPHPDDETLGCGGAIVLHKHEGAEVRVCVMTNGAGVHHTGEGDVSELRKAEALKAGEVLGIDEMIFCEVPDMELHKNIDKIASQVSSLINSYRPDLVYAPSPLDFHPDHRAAFRLIMDIASGRIKLAFYEVYAPIRFNALIDITDVMSQKEKALSMYVSSLLGLPEHFIRTARGLNAYRGFLAQAVPEERFYEAFFVIDKKWSRTSLIEWLTYNL